MLSKFKRNTSLKSLLLTYMSNMVPDSFSAKEGSNGRIKEQKDMRHIENKIKWKTLSPTISILLKMNRLNKPIKR